MRGGFRNWDSKISFFAFADIITAVSGMLIFITLLLATDLERPTKISGPEPDLETEAKLKQVLAALAKVNARNRQMGNLASGSETAPSPSKLQADISTLSSQLAEEKQKQLAFAAEAAQRREALDARDRSLGLDDLKADIKKIADETAALAREQANAREAMARIERDVAQAESLLLKARQREGQLWLIPDRSSTTKEPILATVSGSGLVLERFDHPELRQSFGAGTADANLKSYLENAKRLEQYLVFEIRPSGIGLFQDLVKTARGLGFDVGFDALSENGQIHFSAPPPIDAPPPPQGPPPTASPPGGSYPPGASGSPGPGGSAGSQPAGNDPGAGNTAANAAPPTNASPVAANPVVTKKPAPVPAAPPPEKSWWQRLLEWLGLK